MRANDCGVLRPLHVLVPQREGAIGGADLHVLDLAVQQRAKGRQPVVWAPRASEHYGRLLSNAGVEQQDLSWSRMRTLPRVPEELQIDLVHAHGYESNYLIAALCLLFPQWRRLPTVVTAHGWIETSPWLRFKSTLDRLAARRADVRIASAQAHAHRLPSVFGHNTVVHNGVRPPAEDHSPRASKCGRAPTEPIVVGAVGRLSPEKRVDLVLRAGARLINAGHDIQILIVGGGDERQALENLATDLQIADRVTFTGLVADPDTWYRKMTLLVQASDTEGTPRTVIEAMARCIPVVATRVGDVPALLDAGTCGLLVEPGDPSQIADAVEALVTDQHLAGSLAHRARQRFEDNFTIEAMERGVADCYHQAQAHRRKSIKEAALDSAR